VTVSRENAGITATDDFGDVSLHGLKGLPIASRSKSIVVIGIPVASSYPFDQLGGHSVPLNRKGMVSVVAIDIIDGLQILLSVLRNSRRLGKISRTRPRMDSHIARTRPTIGGAVVSNASSTFCGANGSVSRTSYPADFIVARISSASSERLL
jgi:hypothetical protein